MAMKKRYAPNDRIGEIHDEIDTSFNRNIDCVQPFRAFEPNSILRVNEEVNLVNVEWMDFVSAIRDSPMMKGPNRNGRHRRI